MERTRNVHGISVPAFFYGTAWKEEETEALTRQALAAGFLAIDTANQRKHYFEAGVGDAIAKSGIAREKLFLQTKFTHRRGQDHRLPYDAAASPAEQVEQSFSSSLEHLHTNYLDSYVLHGPSLSERFSAEDWEVLQAMGALQKRGGVRLLGVSNVSIAHLEQLFDADGPHPAFVQNRCYARTGWDREIRTFCKAHDVAYQGFSLLTANAREMGSSTMTRITRRTGKTAAQVVFRFALAVGMIPLTGSSSPEHLAEDLAAFEFDLTDEEVAALETISG